MLKINQSLFKAKSKVIHQHMYTQIQYTSIKFNLETVSPNSICLQSIIMHGIYVTYINFCSTNLQILDFIWVVIAQIFCMPQPTIQNLVKKNLLL